MSRALIPFLFGLSLLGCSPSSVEPPASPYSLSGFFDCVREHEKVLISAHRGGPVSGYPENAIETFAHTAKNGLALLEMDIQTSKDGVLFLLHDDRLGRTTTGTGKASTKTWRQLSQLYLTDQDAKKTSIRIPTLEQVLLWARDQNVILQLDIKPGASYGGILALVEKTGMHSRVMMITYTVAQAVALQKLNPDMILSVSADTPEHFTALLHAGINPANMVAWTGIGTPQPDQYRLLAAQGVEAIAGTIGKIDTSFAKTRKSNPYQTYVQAGALIIATDRAAVVYRQLDADNDTISVCPLP